LLSLEVILGGVRAVIGGGIVGADDCDGSFVTFATKHVRRRETGGTSANDDDGRWGIGGLGCSGFGIEGEVGKFFVNEDVVANALDAPAGDGVKRRSAERRAGAKAEASVVERAAQLFADNQPFHEIGVVVGATGTDCEKFVATARENYVVVADFALDHAAIGQTVGWETLGQVRGVWSCHDTSSVTG